LRQNSRPPESYSADQSQGEKVSGERKVWADLDVSGRTSAGHPTLPRVGRCRISQNPVWPLQSRGRWPQDHRNFLDIAHFPFVHEGILGDQGHPEIEDYEAKIGPEGVLAQGVRVYQPDPYGTGVGDTVVYTYRVHRPLTASLTKESDGPRFSILLMITPHDTIDSTAWIWMAQNYGWDIPEHDLIDYQDEIFGQDRPIVQSQRPELLPLDLQAELHLQSDRTAIAYRRWLNELGVTFGTS